MNIYKISYSWYEGEYDCCLLAKDISIEDFEKELDEATKFAKSLLGIEIEGLDYLGKGYRAECLPEFYKQIIWFLTNKKNYITCYFDEDIEYSVDDDYPEKICIKKGISKREWKEIC